MKARKLYSSIFMSTVLLATNHAPIMNVAWAQQAINAQTQDGLQDLAEILTAEERNSFNGSLAFFRALGFENYLSEIDSSLQNDSLNRAQRVSLTEARQRQETIEASKKLAAFILAKASTRVHDPEFKKRLAATVARTVTYGVLGLPEEPTTDIASMSNSKATAAEKEKAIDAFLEDYITQSANKTLRHMRADIMSVIYSEREIVHLAETNDSQFLKEKAYVSSLVETLARNAYTHLETVKSNYLADFLIKAIARYSYATGDQSIMKELSTLLVNRTGELLSNYISNKTIIVDQKKEKILETLDWKSGDIAQGYTDSAEVFLENVRYSPKGWVEKLTNLVTLRLGLSLGKLQNVANEIQRKKSLGLSLTIKERLASFIINLPTFRRGFNTVGLVEVREYTEPGWGKNKISSVIVYEPRETVGASGIIMHTMRGFIGPVAKRIARVRLNEKAVIAATENDRDLKSTEVSQETLKEANSSGWMRSIVGSKALAAMKSMMTGKKPVTISWASELSNGQMTSMDAVSSAFREGAGVNIITVETEVKKKGKDNLSQEEAMASRPKKLEGAAPNSILWSRTANIESVNIPRTTQEAGIASMYASGTPPVQLAAYNAVNRGTQEISFSQSQLSEITIVAKHTPDGKALYKPSVFAEKRDQWDNITRIDVTTAAIPSDNVMNRQEMTGFLREMGFKDYAKMIRDFQKTAESQSLPTINKNQQETNIKNYEARNYAVEMAVEIMLRMQGRMNNEAGQKQIAQLAAYLTSQQPMKPLNNYPHDVVAETDEEKREEKLVQATEKASRVAMQEHTRLLVAEVLTYIYGNDTAQAFAKGTLSSEKTREIQQLMEFLKPRMARFIEVMYLDSNHGPSRELGDAFTLLAARQAEKRKIESAWRSVAIKAFHRHGIYYEGTVDGVIISKNNDGKVEMIPVNTFDILLTKTKESANSAAIPFGAIPHPELAERAKSFGLKGGLVGIATVVSPDSVSDGLSFVEKLQDKAFDFTSGYSHYGEAIVYQMEGSKIRFKRVRHNYPDPIADAEENLKGARHLPGGWVEVDDYAYFNSSHHARVAVAQKDSQKMYEMFMEAAKKTGVPKVGQEISFGADIYEINENKETGKPIYHQKEMPKVKMRVGMIGDTVVVSQADLNRLYAAKNATEWMKIRTELMGRMSDYFILYGVIFHWITPEGLHHPFAGYCSLTWEMMEMMALGQGTEYLKGDWHKVVRFGKFVYELGQKKKIKWIVESGLKDLATMGGMVIVSPSSKASQHFIKDVKNIQLPWQNHADRVKNDWAVYSRQLSGEWESLLKGSHGRNIEAFFESLNIEPYNIRALTERMDHNLHARAGIMMMIAATVKKILIMEDKKTAASLLDEMRAWIREEDRREKSLHKKEEKAEVRTEKTGGALMCKQVFAN